MLDANLPGMPKDDKDPKEVNWGAAQGEVLGRLRRTRGLRQVELAELIGQPRTVVSNFENGTRTPRPELLTRLAQALGVTVATLLSAPGSHERNEPDPSPGGQRATLAACLQRLVAHEEQYRVERFFTQVDVYGRLSADIPATRRTWAELRQLAADARQATAAPGVTSSDARSAGRSLALRVRDALGLGRSPLPPLDSAADLVGLAAFTVPFSPGADGRLRGALVERDGFGGCVLLNAALDDQHRIHAVAQLLGMALLQPPPAAVLAATWTHPPRATDRLARTTSAEFARELVLPSAALADYLAVSSLLPQTPTQEGERAAHPVRTALLAGLARNYSAPASTLVAQLRTSNAIRSAEAATLERELRPLVHPPSHGRLEPAAVGGAWRAAPQDLPPRFLTAILTAIIDERLSVGRASELTGMDTDDLEVLAVASDTERRRVSVPRDESEDGWSDGWDLQAA